MRGNQPKTHFIPEPLLAFGHGQQSDHPKDGLFLYGPESGSRLPRDVTIGAVGTKKGLQYLRRWVISAGAYIDLPPRKKTDKEHRLHLSAFPGIEEAFGIRLNPGEFLSKQIDEKAVDRATRVLNIHEAVRRTVDLYVEPIRHHVENEEAKVDVWILVAPEIIFQRCRPLAKRSGVELTPGEFEKKQTEPSAQMTLFSSGDRSLEDVIFRDVPNFHRQVKARLLGLGEPSQVLRETTLAPEEFSNSKGYPLRQIQPLASVAWNIATSLYYKTQALPPWRLANVRPGVCYIGLVFKSIPNDPRNLVCCAAQMFLNQGDAVVFRGANGPWRTSKFECHLSSKEATNLVTQVVETFQEKHGRLPNELFIHGKAGFSDDEWEGFRAAVPPEVNLVAVKIQSTGGDAKLFREGDYPVMRGTAIELDRHNALLWTTGYTPRIDSYIGPETPNPLSIQICRSTRGAPSMKQVLADIMGLTKINYNACNYSDGLPVTIRFADKVGDVLVMGSAAGSKRQPLKFYI